MSEETKTIKIKELDLSKLHPYNEKDLKGGAKYIAIGAPGCHSKGTLIRMFNDTLKKVEDIQVGEQIMGDDYTPRNVLNLCRGRELMFDILYYTGKYRVNLHHILSLIKLNGNEKIDISVEDYLQHPKEWRDKYVGYKNHKTHIQYVDISVVPTNIEEEYFGFTLDCNHKYLLHDNTVTHNSGKSSLIKALMYSKKHIIPTIQVFSGTESSNDFFGEWVPPLFIFDGLEVGDLSQIEKFEKRQKVARKYLEPNGFNPWCALIIDDCTYDRKFLKKPIMQKIFKNGRHMNLIHILSLQYAVDIDSSIRSSIDGVFIFREPKKDAREKLFKYYASSIPSFSDFNEIMDELTEDYSCIFIDYKAKTNNLEDCMYYFKADINAIPKGWKFGSKEFWEYNKIRYDPNSKNGI